MQPQLSRPASGLLPCSNDIGFNDDDTHSRCLARCVGRHAARASDIVCELLLHRRQGEAEYGRFGTLYGLLSLNGPYAIA